ncbi:MAG: hypothetical protein CMH30_07985 [Micavibrio sp.]|mgnify:CR=1 FL=1|nr:hypothetical protein [Micavibrio sp.]|tara:strand:- start:553 stop:792 length:240 start_codon:yes stop_codon:yes gene_type:complete
MIHCNCRGINTADIKTAFNKNQITLSDLNDDTKLSVFYSLCVDAALERGAHPSSKPLDKRCPPCKEGFRGFVKDTLALV